MTIDLTPSQCADILAANHYAHLGYCDGDQPYVLPITYLYKDGFLYGYTREGHKIDSMRRNPCICVQVEHVESASAWESVLCCGRFEEVTDPDSIKDIRLMMAEEHGKVLVAEGKMPVFPMVHDLQEHDEKSHHTAVIYRLKPTRMTGKAEREG